MPYVGQQASLILLGCTAAIIAIVQSRDPVYSGIVSASVFAAASALLPEWRINSDTLLCPGNWAIFAFGLQLVVLPVLISVNGPELGSLPFMPSHAAIEAALLLSTLAFLSFLLGFVATMWSRSDVKILTSWEYHRAAVWPFLIIGVVGFLSAFGTDFGTMFLPADRHPVVSPLRGLVGTIFRPFFAFALILVWANKIDQLALRGRRGMATLVTILFGLAIIGPLATHGLGRNIFIIPLLAMAAVYGLKVKRLPMIGMSLGAVLMMLLAVGIGAYRQASKTEDVHLGDELSRLRLAKEIHLDRDAQVYGNGPQFLAFVLEQTDWGQKLWWGSTLVGSAMHPVPELGRSFRSTSGVAIYNRWLYGDPRVLDQILPFEGELFMNFHVPGVVLGYCMLGVLMGVLHRSFMGSTSALSAYLLQFIAVWTGFLVQGGLTSVAYIVLTFSAPVLVYCAWDRLAQKLRPQDRPSIPVHVSSRQAVPPRLLSMR